MVSKNIRIPSIKTLISLYGIDREQAKAMRQVMLAYPPLGDRQCAMNILNAMYGTFGVESFQMTHQNGRIYTITYLNTGDSYKETILYVKPQNSMPFYDVSSWGDWAEKEKREID